MGRWREAIDPGPVRKGCYDKAREGTGTANVLYEFRVPQRVSARVGEDP
jgi:hypothetical protein